MTDGSDHKRVQRKSLCFQRLREEQLRVDKLFSLLSFPAAIFYDRLFNNTVSLRGSPICSMVSPHGKYSEICDRFWNRVGCTHFSVSLEHFMTHTHPPPPGLLSLSLPKWECTDALMSEDKASSIW